MSTFAPGGLTYNPTASHGTLWCQLSLVPMLGDVTPLLFPPYVQTPEYPLPSA